ncbi:hypothetical protein [Streptomyces sp. NPDC096033]|uniref:hypothetical protein n=1 Tax=Streptomyces sp. NPDC096033 TaxID=3366071 RepID=UPI0038217F72
MEITEMFQAQADEGPCIDAYATGDAVHADDLTAHEAPFAPSPWPPAAARLGLGQD